MRLAGSPEMLRVSVATHRQWWVLAQMIEKKQTRLKAKYVASGSAKFALLSKSSRRKKKHASTLKIVGINNVMANSISYELESPWLEFISVMNYEP